MRFSHGDMTRQSHIQSPAGMVMLRRTLTHSPPPRRPSPPYCTFSSRLLLLLTTQHRALLRGVAAGTPPPAAAEAAVRSVGCAGMLAGHPVGRVASHIQSSAGRSGPAGRILCHHGPDLADASDGEALKRDLLVLRRVQASRFPATSKDRRITRFDARCRLCAHDAAAEPRAKRMG